MIEQRGASDTVAPEWKRILGNLKIIIPAAPQD